MSIVAEQCAHGIPLYRSCTPCGRVRTVTGIVPSFAWMDDGSVRAADAPRMTEERIADALERIAAALEKAR